MVYNFYNYLFVQAAEGPVLCVQRCEAQAKSNNNKPAARVAQSSQDRREGNTGLWKS